MWILKISDKSKYFRLLKMGNMIFNQRVMDGEEKKYDFDKYSKVMNGYILKKKNPLDL